MDLSNSGKSKFSISNHIALIAFKDQFLRTGTMAYMLIDPGTKEDKAGRLIEPRVQGWTVQYRKTSIFKKKVGLLGNTF